MGVGCGGGGRNGNLALLNGFGGMWCFLDVYLILAPVPSFLFLWVQPPCRAGSLLRMISPLVRCVSSPVPSFACKARKWQKITKHILPRWVLTANRPNYASHGSQDLLVLTVGFLRTGTHLSSKLIWFTTSCVRYRLSLYDMAQKDQFFAHFRSGRLDTQTSWWYWRL